MQKLYGFSLNAKGGSETPQGTTKKHIPKTGEWKATGQKRNQWLKENEYSLGKDYFNGNGGQNKISQDIYDKNGNIIGRLDRNYRVDGKVVPDHAHLNTDNGNVHHWFND